MDIPKLGLGGLNKPIPSINKLNLANLGNNNNNRNEDMEKEAASIVEDNKQ